MPKGIKLGGRTKGTPNKRTLALQERLQDWGCDPFRVLADTAAGELPCNVCRGAGKSKFQPADHEKAPAERICQSCYGSGKERVSPKERLSAAAELAQYIEPKRKAVEVSNPDGTMRPTSWVVVMPGGKDEPTQ